jgi:inner membrane protein involved in colicin E2 resistance
LNHKTFNEVILPVEIMIEAKQEDKKTTISIVYNNAVFNEDLTFPYNVPDGYERINID